MRTPVPLLHTRGSAVSKAAPLYGGVGPQGTATHRQPTKRLLQHRVQGCPGCHIGQHLHHITPWSTARLWELGAGLHPQPPLPCAPVSYLRWQRGCHTAAPAPLSPGQRAALPPHPHRDKQPAGSACTGSPGGHRAPHQHAVSPAMGTYHSAGHLPAPAPLPVPQPHLCPERGGIRGVRADGDGVEGVVRLDAIQSDIGAAA